MANTRDRRCSISAACVCMYVCMCVLLTCNWSFEFSIDYAAHGASRMDNRRAVDFASMARLTGNGSLCLS